MTSDGRLRPLTSLTPHTDGGEWELLGNNLLLILNILWWVTVTMGPLFGAMRLFKVARVSAEIEEEGMDSSKHGVNNFSSSTKTGTPVKV